MNSFLDFLDRYGLVSMKQGIILAFSLGLVLSTFLISDSYGHGIGYELLPPVNLGNKMVSLEISSSQYNDPLSTDRQISFSLLDIDSSITLRDVTFHVLATKGDNFLFEDTFQSDNGILKMNLIPSESNKISIKKDTKSEGFFQSLIGIQNDVFEIEGSVFKSGGLYQFKVNILTAESYTNQLDEPLMFDVGLSIPDTTYHDIEDPDFGKQQLRVISYYDEIENFRYNHKIRSIEFSMPFEWSKNNVNQTAFIHEEILIPKKFGDLMASSFSSSVNGFELPERVITIDDFLGKNRIIHLIINQNDLQELLEKQDKTDGMEFLVKPNSQNLSMLTENGQFRITLGWEPSDIKSNAETT